MNFLRTPIALALLLVSMTTLAAPLAAAPAAQASFADTSISAQAHQIADWTITTGDHQGLPFVIVDKVAARLYLFDEHGQLKGATAVLLGGARGDVSPPGVGDKPLAQISVAERITPAGRFVADRGLNLKRQDIVWVDYAAAIAIHRVTDITSGTTVSERLKRLASPSPRDRRVSFGCINVSEAFYDRFVGPTFAGSSGIVYILPETQTLAKVFPTHDAGVQLQAHPS